MIADIFAIPGVILIAGALLLVRRPARLGTTLLLIFPILAPATILIRPEGYSVTPSLASLDLILMQVDDLSRIFGIIFASTALIAGIYAWHIKDLSQQIGALVYAGGALGVTFAGDLFTLLIFWELMAVSSTLLIWAHRNRRSDAAGLRYLVYHALGGSILLGGILMHYSETGSLLVQALEPSASLSSVMMLLGVSINAAVIPLHTWLTDAYPKATVTGAVFMSAFTTKSAVYVLIRVFPGWELLAWIGTAMAIYGVIYAVICKDMREILSYHIVSQVGFMVAGIGIGTDLALNGATAHAYSHILYKSLMFMGAGAVLYATGTTKLIELGGLKNKMRWTMILYMIGAFSISGLPLFNGFISKAMTVTAAGYADFEPIQLLLLLAGVGTFLSVGLKLPYFTWFDKEDNDIEVRELPVNMYIAMGLAAFLCIFYGLFPEALYTYLPYEIAYNPYTVYHLVEITQTSLLTFVGFWIFRQKLAGERILALDVDWFYRKPAPLVRRIFVESIDDFYGRAEEAVQNLAQWVADQFINPMEWLAPFSREKIEARTFSPSFEQVLSLIIIAFVIFGVFMVV